MHSIAENYTPASDKVIEGFSRFIAIDGLIPKNEDYRIRVPKLGIDPWVGTSGPWLSYSDAIVIFRALSMKMSRENYCGLRIEIEVTRVDGLSMIMHIDGLGMGIDAQCLETFVS